MIKTFYHHLRRNVSPSFSTKYRLAFFLASILFFAFFVLFTFIVRSDALRSFDFNTTVRLQAHIPRRADAFFSFLSVFGRFETTFIIFLAILFVKRKLLGLVAFFLFGLAHIIEIVGKTFLSQPGPPHMFLRTHDLAQEFPGFYIHTDASYPSGHAMRIIFISIILISVLFINKKLPTYSKIFSFIFVSCFAFLMLLSRVSLGEHWTTDVVGGSFLGASFAFLSLLFL